MHVINVRCSIYATGLWNRKIANNYSHKQNQQYGKSFGNKIQHFTYKRGDSWELERNIAARKFPISELTFPFTL